MLLFLFSIFFLELEHIWRLQDERQRAGDLANSTNKTRAGSQISGEAGAEALEAMKNVFPRHAMQPQSSAGLFVGHFGVQGLCYESVDHSWHCFGLLCLLYQNWIFRPLFKLSFFVFAISGSSTMSGAEQDSMASCRYMMEGTRTIVCSPYDAVIQLMMSLGIPKDKCDVRSIWEFYMTMDKSTVEHLLKHGPIFVATQGPGLAYQSWFESDLIFSLRAATSIHLVFWKQICFLLKKSSRGDAIYIPAGYVFAEKVAPNCDALGCVVRFLVSSENDTSVEKRLNEVSRAIKDSGGQGSTSFQNILDFYKSWFECGRKDDFNQPTVYDYSCMVNFFMLIVVWWYFC